MNNAERHQYFTDKVGKEITEIKEYLDSGRNFLAFLISPKAAGKGTKSGFFIELIGEDRVTTISVGDLVRDLNILLESDDQPKINELKNDILKYYRSTISIDDAFNAVLNREQVTDKIAIPTELIMALVKNKLSKPEFKNKGVFLDGFPRSLEQVSLSLYLKDIMNFQDNPDFAVLIDAPDEVIKARLEGRIVCPLCKSSRHSKLSPTEFVDYNADTDTYEIKCDNPNCTGYKTEVLQGKEGDSDGFSRIESRVRTDKALMNEVRKIKGLPIIEVPNSILISENQYDDYELTPEYYFEIDENNTVKTVKKKYQLKDDQGEAIYMIEAPTTVLPMIKGIHKILLG